MVSHDVVKHYAVSLYCHARPQQFQFGMLSDKGRRCPFNTVDKPFTLTLRRKDPIDKNLYAWWF